MFIQDFILLSAISWYILQGCLSYKCEYYHESDIKEDSDCERLEIENGWVCYTEIDDTQWEARISCLHGFHLDGWPTRRCTYNWKYYFVPDWSWDNLDTRCERDKTTTTPRTTAFTSSSTPRTTAFTSSSTPRTTAFTSSSTPRTTAFTSSSTPRTTTFTSSSTPRTTAITSSSIPTTVTPSSTSTVSSAMTSSPAVATSEQTKAKYSTAESDKETKSRLVVYVCVSIATVVSIVIVLAIIVHKYRRHKRITTKVANSEDVDTSSGSNNLYDNADVMDPNANVAVENLESEYVAISDTGDQPIGEDEYNTINTQERRNSDSIYNHIQMHVQSDTYDSTKHCSSNVQGGEGSYSHLNVTGHPKENSRLTNDAVDDYNTLKVDDNFVAMDEQHFYGEESYYDNTEEKTEKTSRIELSSYDHVEIGVYTNEGIRAFSQKYHEHF